jgi:hypothetical protein
MAGNSRQAGVTVTSPVLAVLGAFDAEHRALSLSDLARRADLPLATAHRIIGELVEGGLLARRPSGHYVVGRRLWDLGLLALVPSQLAQVASPFLHDLYGATGATVHLAVRDGTQVLYLDRLSGSASVPVVSQVGSRLPMHATGVGKVMLTYARHAVHRRVPGAAAGATTAGAPGRVRADQRGDEPRRLLGRRAGALGPGRGRRRPRHRGAEPAPGPAPPGGGAPGRGTRHRPPAVRLTLPLDGIRP